MKGNLDLAIELAADGYHILPVHPADGTEQAKRPYIEAWQDRATTSADQLRAWWDRYPDAVPAVHCGKSGVVVYDLENPTKGNGAQPHDNAATLGLTDHPTMVVSSPSGGQHWYYRAPVKHYATTDPNGERVTASRPIAVRGCKLYDDEGTFYGDVKAGNGYVLAPGVEGYRRVTDHPVRPLPAELVGVGKRSRDYGDADAMEKAAAAVQPGERSDWLIGVAGTLSRRTMGDYDYVAQRVRDFNAAMPEPLRDDELERTILKSARRYCAKDATDGAEAVESHWDPFVKRGDAEPRNAPAPFETFDLYAIASMPEPEWLVQGLFVDGDSGMVYGRRGSGKSLLALDLALSVASGRGQFMGRKCARGGALYITLENTTFLNARIKAWRAARSDEWLSGSIDDDALTENFRALYVTEDNGRITHANADRLVATVEALQPRVVVLDTFARWTPGVEENSAKDVGVVVEALDAVKRAGCALIVVHHAGKNGDQGARGSSKLEDSFVSVVRLDKEKGSPHITVTQPKNNNGPEVDPVALTIDTYDNGPALRFTAFNEVHDDGRHTAYELVANAQRKGALITHTALIEGMGMRATDARAVVAGMLEDDELTGEKLPTGKGSAKAMHYRIGPDAPGYVHEFLNAPDDITALQTWAVAA